jgi:hypothetical protein
MLHPEESYGCLPVQRLMRRGIVETQRLHAQESQRLPQRDLVSLQPLQDAQDGLMGRAVLWLGQHRSPLGLDHLGETVVAPALPRFGLHARGPMPS